MAIRIVKKPFSEDRIWRSIFRILRENVLCSMSTVAPGNRAHINTAYFCATPNLEVYFLSDPSSRHCRNLERNASMAMTIFNSSQEWAGRDRGLQLFGPCRRVRGRSAAEAARWYGSRFPTYRTWMRGTSAVDRRRTALLRSYGFYRFLPRRVKILDEREFGGTTFVVAFVKRDRPAEGGRRTARITGQAAGLLVASEPVRTSTTR